VEATVDIAAWLKNLGLEQYETAFRDNAIDGDLLPSLTAEDLKDLGVKIVGHRRKLLDAIAAIGAASRPTPPPALADPPVTLQAPAVASRPQSRSGANAERRPITVMFCDLAGSTSLAATLDAEDWRDLVGAYLDDAAKAIGQYGGHVAKKLGDGLMALFGYPRAQENDAERAARAGLAILRALEDLNVANASRGLPALAARIGLDSGPVVVDSAGEVFGDAPNLAARVQNAAAPGTITAAVWRHNRRGGNVEQRREQGRKLDRIELHLRQRGFEVGKPALRRHVDSAKSLLAPLGQRMQRGVLQQLRRGPFDPGMGPLGELATKLIDETRLPDSGLADDLNELPLAASRALPAFDENCEIVVAPDKRRLDARSCATAPAAGPHDPVQNRRACNAFEFVRAFVFDNE
jgi:class 3 adenylate cyclase